MGPRGKRGRSAKCAIVEPEHGSCTGRWFLFSLLYLGAVAKTARWVAKEARIRKLQRQFAEQVSKGPGPRENRARSAMKAQSPPASSSRRKSSASKTVQASRGQREVPMDGREGDRAERMSERQARPGGQSEVISKSAARIYDNPAVTMSPEGEFGPEDDLRAREFPVPPAALKSVTHKVAIDQDMLTEGGVVRGGKIGEVEGDADSLDITTSIEDQAGIEPDLQQELG